MSVRSVSLPEGDDSAVSRKARRASGLGMESRKAAYTLFISDVRDRGADSESDIGACGCGEGVSGV